MFQFVQRRRYYFLFSALLVGAGIVAMIISTVRTGRPFLVGVDFQSGTRFEVQFAEPVSEDELRELFTSLGIGNPIVTSLGGQGLENAWQIRTEFRSRRSRAPLTALEEDLAPLVPTRPRCRRSAVGRAEVTRAAFIAVSSPPSSSSSTS